MTSLNNNIKMWTKLKGMFEAGGGLKPLQGFITTNRAPRRMSEITAPKEQKEQKATEVPTEQSAGLSPAVYHREVAASDGVIAFKSDDFRG